MHKLGVTTFSDAASFAILQSDFHVQWTWKYSSTLRNAGINYAPTDCFQNFPFPESLRSNHRHAYDTTLLALDAIGEQYHEYRRGLMEALWLGLTDIYNLFHAPDLEKQLAKLYAKRGKSADWLTKADVPPELHAVVGLRNEDQARESIEELRRLHIRLDEAVLAAYGWHQTGPDGPAIDLAHGFHEVDYLPENDRTRFTLHPTARRELLTRLLKLNHTRAAEEQNATHAASKVPSVRKTARQSVIQLTTDDLDLFRPAAIQHTPSQPRELALPTCKRVPLVPADTFLLVFVHEFLSRAGDQSTLRNLDGVFHLLRHRKAHSAEITSILGDLGEKWIKRFNDTLPNDEFIPFLKRLETQKWIEVDARTGTISKLPKFQAVPEDEWRAFDIDAALIVLSSRPEVLELVTTTKDASRSTQAFGIIKTA